MLKYHSMDKTYTLQRLFTQKLVICLLNIVEKCIRIYGHIGLNITLTLISFVPFYFLNVTTSKVKRMYVACIIFLLNSTSIECW